MNSTTLERSTVPCARRALLPLAAVVLAIGCSTGSGDATTDASASDPRAATTNASAPMSDATPDPNSDTSGPTVQVKVFDSRGELVGPLEVPAVVHTRDEWRKLLGPEQFQILRAEGTERPFCGTLLDNKMEGVYTCGGCGLPLFASASKFDSGTGWPSFFQPIADENIAEHVDTKLLVPRTEIECTRCGGHLGHVFDDGPRPTGLRYCLNSEALEFTELGDVADLADPAAER